MKEIFPWIFATALLLAGSAFLYAGVKLTSTAWTLKTSGEQTTATIERVEVREAHVRKDDAPAIVHYYTEVVSFTAWDGSKVEARLPEKNDDEARGRPSDPIEIRYRHDDPSVAAPVNAQRFAGLKTPCSVTGLCADCTGPDSICCQIVTTRICRPAGRIKVVLVGEDLGL
jgi:hypothetical protein